MSAPSRWFFFGLQEYVKARLLQFVGEPVFAKRMYQTVEGVQRVAREVLTELSVPAGNSLQDGVTGAYSLQFRHDCRSAFFWLSCSLNTRAAILIWTDVSSTASWLHSCLPLLDLGGLKHSFKYQVVLRQM